jgi:hypothetical protein
MSAGKARGTMGERLRQQGPPGTETDGFAWASFVTGSIALFYADRLLYPTPQNYLLLSLLMPAAGIGAALVAHRRIAADETLRGRNLAMAGAFLSALSGSILLLTKIFVN